LAEIDQELNESYKREKKRQEIAHKLKNFRHLRSSEAIKLEKEALEALEIPSSPTSRIKVSETMRENGGLVNLIDKLVIEGQLGMEAVRYFHPE